MVSGTRLLFVWMLLGVSMGFGVAKAQAVLGFTNAQGFPAIVNPGQAVQLSGWIRNSGTASFSGLLDIEFLPDSGVAFPLDNNFPVSNLQPGDSVLWSLSNYNFPPGILRQNNNDVLIWPTRPNGNPDVDVDTLSFAIYYTEGSAFKLQRGDFHAMNNGVTFQSTYQIVAEAINFSKVANIKDVCLFVSIPTKNPICIDTETSSIAYRSSALFQFHDFRIIEEFGLTPSDTLIQAIDVIEFYAMELEVTSEPFNIIRIPILSNAVAVSPVQPTVDIQIYPNPLQDVVHIDLPDAWVADAQVHLLDLAGRLVGSYVLENGQIQLEELPAGSYLLEIVSRKGTYRQQVIRR
jgi:hypothetical protein